MIKMKKADPHESAFFVKNLTVRDNLIMKKAELPPSRHIFRTLSTGRYC